MVRVFLRSLVGAIPAGNPFPLVGLTIADWTRGRDQKQKPPGLPYPTNVTWKTYKPTDASKFHAFNGCETVQFAPEGMTGASPPPLPSSQSQSTMVCMQQQNSGDTGRHEQL